MLQFSLKDSMSLDPYTFGATPAAQYLVRTLNEHGSQSIKKSCANRSRSFNTNVNQIENAVASGVMSAHAAANFLRLLREDATKITFADVGQDKFIAQLLRNVIIGNIKRAIRKVTTMRKVENSNVNFDKMRHKGSAKSTSAGTIYTVLGLDAGIKYNDGDYYRVYPDYDCLVDTTTPELLMERSNRRCLRQGKPHMNEKIPRRLGSLILTKDS